MKYKKLNIKAFTVWELLISILLVSLLVTFTYTLLIKGQLLISQDQKIQEQIDEFIWFNKKLQDEVANSDSILFRQNQIYFFVAGISSGFVTIIDSTITYSNVDYSFVSEFQISGLNLNYLDESDVLIDKITFNLKGIGGEYSIILLKSYSKQVLYNLRRNEYKHI